MGSSSIGRTFRRPVFVSRVEGHRKLSRKRAMRANSSQAGSTRVFIRWRKLREGAFSSHGNLAGLERPSLP